MGKLGTTGNSCLDQAMEPREAGPGSPILDALFGLSVSFLFTVQNQIRRPVSQKVN